MNNNITLFKQLRENKGLTQSSFAKKIGVSRSTIAKIEAGEMEISNKIIQKLYDNFSDDIKILSDIYKNNTANNSDLIKVDIVDYQEKELIYSTIKSLWESIDRMFYSIILLYELKENIISNDQYGFLADINNRYQDEENIYLNNLFPSSEREYKEPYTIINIKDLDTNQLLIYLEELSKNNKLFSNIFYKNFSNYRNEIIRKKL